MGNKTKHKSTVSSDLRAVSSDLEAETSDLEAETSDLRAETSDLEAETSDLEAETSDLEAETSDIEKEKHTPVVLRSDHRYAMLKCYLCPKSINFHSTAALSSHFVQVHNITIPVINKQDEKQPGGERRKDHLYTGRQIRHSDGERQVTLDFERYTNHDHNYAAIENPLVVKDTELSGDLEKNNELSDDLERNNELSDDLERNNELSGDLERNNELSGDLERNNESSGVNINEQNNASHKELTEDHGSNHYSSNIESCEGSVKDPYFIVEMDIDVSDSEYDEPDTIRMTPTLTLPPSKRKLDDHDSSESMEKVKKKSKMDGSEILTSTACPEVPVTCPTSLLDSLDASYINLQPWPIHYEEKRLNKVHYCTYCMGGFTTIASHFWNQHTDENEVARIRMMPIKERREAILKLTNAGDFKHNIEVMKQGKGTLTTVSNRMVLSDLSTLFPDLLNVSAGLKENVLKKMLNNEVTFTVQNDSLILGVGEQLFQKHGHQVHLHSYIGQKMRLLGRFLICARQTDPSIMSLSDVFVPEKYLDVTIAATRTLCLYDENTNVYNNRSLAIKLGHLLTQCARIQKSVSLLTGNVEQGKKSDGYLTLIANEYINEVSDHAIKTMNEDKALQLTKDVVKLHGYLQKRTDTLATSLLQKISKQKFQRISKTKFYALKQVTLARLVLLNQTLRNETQHITVRCYKSRLSKSCPLKDEVEEYLSPVETLMCVTFSRMEIRAENGRTVPMFLTPALEASIDLLLKYRTEAAFHADNPYVFVGYEPMQPINCDFVLKKFLLAAQVAIPNNITSTNTILSQHVALVTQISNLNILDTRTMVELMRHNINVHEDFYKLPQEHMVVNMRRMLSAIDRGTIDQYKRITQLPNGDSVVSQCVNSAVRDPVISQCVESVVRDPVISQCVDSAVRDSVVSQCVNSVVRDPAVSQCVDSAVRDPAVSRCVDSAVRDPAVSRCVDSAVSDPAVSRCVDSAVRDPVVSRCVDSAVRDPAVSRCVDSAVRDPAVSWCVDSAVRDPAVSRCVDSAVRDPAVSRCVDSAVRDPAVSRCVDSAVRDPAVSWCVDSAVRDPAVSQCVDSAVRVPVVSRCVDSAVRDPAVSRCVDSAVRDPAVSQCVDSAVRDPAVSRCVDSEVTDPAVSQCVDSAVTDPVISQCGSRTSGGDRCKKHIDEHRTSNCAVKENNSVIRGQIVSHEDSIISEKIACDGSKSELDKLFERRLHSQTNDKGTNCDLEEIDSVLGDLVANQMDRIRPAVNEVEGTKSKLNKFIELRTHAQTNDTGTNCDLEEMDHEVSDLVASHEGVTSKDNAYVGSKSKNDKFPELKAQNQTNDKGTYCDLEETDQILGVLGDSNMSEGSACDASKSKQDKFFEQPRAPGQTNDKGTNCDLDMIDYVVSDLVASHEVITSEENTCDGSKTKQDKFIEQPRDKSQTNDKRNSCEPKEIESILSDLGFGDLNANETKDDDVRYTDVNHLSDDALQYIDDHEADPDFTFSDSESLDFSISSIYSLNENPELMDFDESTNLESMQLNTEDMCTDDIYDSGDADSDNEVLVTQGSQLLDTKKFLKSLEDCIPSCSVTNSEWWLRHRYLEKQDLIFCEKYSSVYVKKKTDGNSNSKTGRYYDVVHPCVYCGRLLTHVKPHLLKKHSQEDCVKEIVKLEKYLARINCDDSKKFLRDQIRKKLNLLRNEGDHKYNVQVMRKHEGELMISRRPKGLFNSEHYGPCPDCMEWIKLKADFSLHRPHCPKNTQCLPSDANIKYYQCKGKKAENVGDKMKSEVFPSMKQDELSRIAVHDTLIVAVGEWYFVNNVGKLVNPKDYCSYRMRISARLLQIVREELQVNDATMSQCLVRENFYIFAKAALRACGTQTEEELQIPNIALKMGYDLERLVAVKMSCDSKKDRKDAKRFAYLLHTEWNIKVQRQAMVLLEEQSFNISRTEHPDSQNVTAITDTDEPADLENTEVVNVSEVEEEIAILYGAKMHAVVPGRGFGMRRQRKKVTRVRWTEDEHKEIEEYFKDFFEGQKKYPRVKDCLHAINQSRVCGGLLASRSVQTLKKKVHRMALQKNLNRTDLQIEDFDNVAGLTEYTQASEGNMVPRDNMIDEEMSVLDDDSDGLDEVVLGREFGKRKRNTVTRVPWTKEETTEIKEYFKDFFKGQKRYPGVKHCLHAINQSKAHGGLLGRRNWETIKKKVHRLGNEMKADPTDIQVQDLDKVAGSEHTQASKDNMARRDNMTDQETSVLEDETDDLDEVVLSRECGKRKRTSVKRVPWTSEEHNEIKEYFKDCFEGEKTCPARKDCLRAISQSKSHGGLLARRNWETVKKKVNHMARKKKLEN